MKNTTVLIWGIIVAIVLGMVILYAIRNNNPASIINVNPASPALVTINPNPTTPIPVSIPPAAQPNAPLASTDSKATPSDTTVIVSGKVTPNGALTSYWYEYGVTTNLGSKTANQSVGSSYNAISAPAYISGLVKDTTYYFRLVAENTFGKNFGTEYSFRTTQGNPPPVGGLPTAKTLAAKNITKTGVNLSGEVTANKVATTYWFEYGQTTNLGNTTADVTITETAVRFPTTITLVDLASSTTYYFRINAQNQFGTVNGSTLNFKTK